MGMFEYEVSLSEAKGPEDMDFVARAFRAGVEKERERIINSFMSRTNGYNNIYISIDDIKNIVNERETK